MPKKKERVYVRMTKKILEGDMKGLPLTNIAEVPNERIAKSIIKAWPAGTVLESGFAGPKAEIIEHDYAMWED
jgi:hypothetical protein